MKFYERNESPMLFQDDVGSTESTGLKTGVRVGDEEKESQIRGVRVTK